MKFDEMVGLLGRHVQVSLGDDDGDRKVVAEGLLIRISDFGEVVLLDEMGNLNFCWPALDMQATPLTPQEQAVEDAKEESQVSRIFFT